MSKFRPQPIKIYSDLELKQKEQRESITVQSITQERGTGDVDIAGAQQLEEDPDSEDYHEFAKMTGDPEYAV
jgi:hypothetical protein